jgi:hypothetical protein
LGIWAKVSFKIGWRFQQKVNQPRINAKETQDKGRISKAVKTLDLGQLLTLLDQQ